MRTAPDWVPAEFSPVDETATSGTPSPSTSPRPAKNPPKTPPGVGPYHERINVPAAPEIRSTRPPFGTSVASK